MISVQRLLALVLLAAACAPADPARPDSGTPAAADAEPFDAGPRDTSVLPDAGESEVDAGPPICAGGVCEGPCCEAHGAAGCDDLGVTRCVCDVLPDCCRVWAEECVIVAASFQCAPCQVPGPVCGDGSCDGENNETCLSCPQDCGACAGPCCEANGTPGCDDPQLSACVCEFEGVCCEGPWDAECVSAIERRGCGACGG